MDARLRRHQSDVCHAYQVLRRGGLRASRIVVMMQDDLARAENNPHPGKIFNRPGAFFVRVIPFLLLCTAE